jgi:hypothetical protein
MTGPPQFGSIREPCILLLGFVRALGGACDRMLV